MPVLIAAVLLFATAQGEGQQWWSDAPRHALNGAFIRDLLLAMPWHDPKTWAIAYYLQYPALTILFYPPLFPAVEAISFLLFGVSTHAALFTVALFYAALGLGAWRLLARWMPSGTAAAGAVFFMGLAEIAFWGRQVMLDIPAYAFLLWTAVVFLRFLDLDRPRDLWLTVALLVAGLYTKQTIVFIVPVLALVLVRARGAAALRDRRLWAAAAVSAIALIPLAVMTVKFGETNVGSVTGVVDRTVTRFSWGGLTYYLAALPGQMGWIGALLGVAGAAALAWRRAWRPAAADWLLLTLWFAVGYVFFWAIDLKDPRFSLVILFPLAAATYIVLARVLSRPFRAPAAWLLALGSFGYTLAFAPVPVVKGYMEAARWVRENTPPGVVLFSGKRDGSFIFNLRTLDPDRRYAVIRADKLLLELAIRRELGVKEKDMTRDQIGDTLTKYGVGYVVAERDFWTDLKPMAELQELLDSDRFEEVARIPIAANVPHPDKELRIYRNRATLPDAAARIEVKLPAIGQTFKGELPH